MKERRRDGLTAEFLSLKNYLLQFDGLKQMEEVEIIGKMEVKFCGSLTLGSAPEAWGGARMLGNEGSWEEK